MVASQRAWRLFTEDTPVTKSVNEQDPVLVKLRKNPLNLTTNAEVDQGNYITALTMGLPYLAVCINTLFWLFVPLTPQP